MFYYSFPKTISDLYYVPLTWHMIKHYTCSSNDQFIEVFHHVMSAIQELNHNWLKTTTYIVFEPIMI